MYDPTKKWNIRLRREDITALFVFGMIEMGTDAGRVVVHLDENDPSGLVNCLVSVRAEAIRVRDRRTADQAEA